MRFTVIAGELILPLDLFVYPPVRLSMLKLSHYRCNFSLLKLIDVVDSLVGLLQKSMQSCSIPQFTVES